METVAGVDNTPVTHGTISGTAPHITYTPEANYFIQIDDNSGAGNHDHSKHVRLIFTVTDDANNVSNQGVVEIGVTGVQDPPIIHLGEFTDPLNTITESIALPSLNIRVYEDETIDLSRVIHNENVDIYDYLTWSLLSAPTRGTASVSGYSQGEWDNTENKKIVRPSTFNYTSSENFNGNDSFTARVYDPYLNEDQITINIEVVPVNDAPVITSTAPTTATEDILYTYTSVITDVDDVNNGTDLTYYLTNAPADMTISNTGLINWTPTEGILTSGEVTLTVTDGGEK
jgi:hypothetical protein